MIKFNRKRKIRKIRFDLVYSIGRHSNSIVLESLKFANSMCLEKENFNNMRIKIIEYIFENSQYITKNNKEKTLKILDIILLN